MLWEAGVWRRRQLRVLIHSGKKWSDSSCTGAPNYPNYSLKFRIAHCSTMLVSGNPTSMIYMSSHANTCDYPWHMGADYVFGFFCESLLTSKDRMKAGEGSQIYGFPLMMRFWREAHCPI